MTSAFRILVVLFVLAAAGFAGVIYLAQAVEPPVQPVEKVLPNDRFPR